MKPLSLFVAATAVVLALAACAVSTRGTLVVDVAGLSPGTLVTVTVTEGGVQVAQFDAPGQIALDAGSYVVSAAVVPVPSTTFAGIERFAAADRQVSVVAEQTTQVTLAFEYEGFTIFDPDDDAVGLAPRYDVVELRSHLEGSNLRVSLVLIASQTNTSQLVGFVDFDVDRNGATGGPSNASNYCSGVVDDLGSEFYIDFSLAAPYADLYPSGGGIASPLAVETDGSRVTFVVPVAAIGGNPRVDGATVIGNSGEPTDCVPFGPVSPPAP